MKKLLIAAAVAGTMVSGVAFASINTVPNHNVGGQSDWKLTTTATAEVTASTCEISVTDSEMSEKIATMTQLELEKNSSNPHTFTYQFTKCPKHIGNKQGLQLVFETNHAKDIATGILKNVHENEAERAENAYIQLYNTSGDALNLNQPLKFEKNTDKNDVSVSFSAKLVKNGGNPGAGKVKGTITATVGYY